MPINPNDFSINNIALDSQFKAEEYASRVIPNTGRQNVNQAMKTYKSNNATKNTLRFPIDTPKYYLEMQIAKYDRSNLFKLNFSTETTILLPLSNQIQDNDSVTYTEENAGPLLGNALNQLGVSGAIEKAKNALTNISSLSDGVKQLNDLFKTATDGQGTKQQLQQALAAGNAVTTGGVLEAAQGIAPVATNAALGFLGYSPNQFFTVLMKGPNYKSYVFVWKLFPKNLQESNQINNIILKLQNAKAPGTTAGGALWTFPNIFKLGYRPNTKYLHKFKPSVLEEIAVDYAPGGSAAFYAGTENPPEAVIISAKFKELEYWLTGDYNDRPNPFLEGGNV